LLVTVKTVKANGDPETNNRIKGITFNTGSNVVVLPTRPEVGQSTVTFNLIRPELLNTVAVGAGTQPFTITDRCGTYNSFAGGGPAAWGP